MIKDEFELNDCISEIVFTSFWEAAALQMELETHYKIFCLHVLFYYFSKITFILNLTYLVDNYYSTSWTSQFCKDKKLQDFLTFNNLQHIVFLEVTISGLNVESWGKLQLLKRSFTCWFHKYQMEVALLILICFLDSNWRLHCWKCVVGG